MSEFTNMQKLVASLKRHARVQDSEGFIDPSEFVALITDAVDQHNPSYTATEAECTVPSREQYPVVLLAWSMLCYVRASKFAADASTSQGGFNTDRNTPFQKCLALAKELMTLYTQTCKSLGLDTFAGTGSVVQSEVVTENADLAAMTPVEMSLDPPPVVLVTVPAAQVNSDGTLLVKWEQPLFQNFSHYIVSTLEGGDDKIFQDWNFGSKSNVPRLHDDAEISGRIDDQAVKQVKITDFTVTPSGAKNRVIVVCVSKSGKYSYSNEVLLTQP